MPTKFTRKSYIENGYYHVYNRGVEKRTIFQEQQDCDVFVNYLKQYLTPPPDPKTLLQTFTLKGEVFKGVPRQPNNYAGEIKLVAFALMPNHFHLLIHQKSSHSMNKFMQSLTSRYTTYFNKKYQRVGSLFQGPYKGILVSDEPYLLHLSRYIHQNPKNYVDKLTEAYSSYSQYLGQTHADWVDPSSILGFFGKADPLLLKQTQTYQQFVESDQIDSAGTLGRLTIEETEE